MDCTICFWGAHVNFLTKNDFENLSAWQMGCYTAWWDIHYLEKFQNLNLMHKADWRCFWQRLFATYGCHRAFLRGTNVKFVIFHGCWLSNYLEMRGFGILSVQIMHWCIAWGWLPTIFCMSPTSCDMLLAWSLNPIWYSYLVPKCTLALWHFSAIESL